MVSGNSKMSATLDSFGENNYSEGSVSSKLLDLKLAILDSGERVLISNAVQGVHVWIVFIIKLKKGLPTSWVSTGALGDNAPFHNAA